MSKKKYKYDVAFSFLQNDENIAIKLGDLFKERFTTFIDSLNKRFYVLGFVISGNNNYDFHQSNLSGDFSFLFQDQLLP